MVLENAKNDFGVEYRSRIYSDGGNSEGCVVRSKNVKPHAFLNEVGDGSRI